MFCSLTQQQSSTPAIRHWEEAGTALDIAITRYLDSCCLLGPNSLRQGASASDLSNRIDLALEKFHVKLEQHAVHARSTLAETRNKLMSPIHRVPREILSEIFAYVIYTPLHPYASFNDPMERTLDDIYCSLYHLLGVCSLWRTVALSRGSLWSIIPIMRPTYPICRGLHRRHPCSTRLGLGSAGDGDLHLAVFLPDRDLETNNIHDLTPFAPRFRTVNIMCDGDAVIHRILSYFRGHDPSGRLKELSIYLRFPLSWEANQVPAEIDYVFRPNHPKQHLFEQLVKSLSVLRLRGALFHLDAAISSSQLVEIQLQDLTLGHDSKMTEILEALSSATGLRHLKVISVKTFPDPGPIQSTISTANVLLPNLLTLLLRDLYSNTLQLFLSLTLSRAHSSTLHLTRKCTQVRRPGQVRPEAVDIQRFLGLPGCSFVNTLMIGGDSWGWTSAEKLREVIQSLPNLDTLQTMGWNCTEEYCPAMSRPQISGPIPFPRIKHLHLYSATIESMDSFTAMVASHFGFLESMILGSGVMKPIEGEDDEEFIDLVDKDEVVIWIRGHVQKLELISWDYIPRELQEKPEWHLW